MCGEMGEFEATFAKRIIICSYDSAYDICIFALVDHSHMQSNNRPVPLYAAVVRKWRWLGRGRVGDGATV